MYAYAIETNISRAYVELSAPRLSPKNMFTEYTYAYAIDTSRAFVERIAPTLSPKNMFKE